MGYYRPRPSEVKGCKHCGIPFETNHKRAIYCGESCRQLAYQARHRFDQKKSHQAEGGQEKLPQVKSALEGLERIDSPFSDVGANALVTGAVAMGNYIFNDWPAQEAILSKLDGIEKGTELGLGQLLSAAQTMVDYVNVQVENDFTLKMKIEKLHADRLQQQAKKERQEQLKSARLLAIRRR